MANSTQDQNLSLFISDSKIISSINAGFLNEQLREALADGYVQYGAPFAWGNGNLAVNVVKFDQRLVDMSKKIVELGLAQLEDL